MLEAASILAAYLSFALLHGAQPARLPAKLAESVRAFDAWCLGARLAAGFFLTLSVWLWSLAASGAVVWTGPLAAWMLSGVFIVLVRPVWSTFVWGLAAAFSPAIIFLSVLGGI